MEGEVACELESDGVVVEFVGVAEVGGGGSAGSFWGWDNRGGASEFWPNLPMGKFIFYDKGMRWNLQFHEGALRGFSWVEWGYGRCGLDRQCGWCRTVCAVGTLEGECLG